MNRNDKLKLEEHELWFELMFAKKDFSLDARRGGDALVAEHLGK